MSELSELLDDSSVIVCCGSGESRPKAVRRYGIYGFQDKRGGDVDDVFGPFGGQ